MLKEGYKTSMFFNYYSKKKKRRQILISDEDTIRMRLRPSSADVFTTTSLVFPGERSKP